MKDFEMLEKVQNDEGMWEELQPVSQEYKKRKTRKSNPNKGCNDDLSDERNQ